jgi:hypothetical protein
MAGYSGTPLVKKLGLADGAVAFVKNEPARYWEWLSPLPEGVIIRRRISPVITFAHLFVTSATAFRKDMLAVKKVLTPNGMIWISWPKKSSGVATDLDENIIRDTALKNGLVDVKVCAVDETWSGLKLVIPVKLRPQQAPKPGRVKK